MKINHIPTFAFGIAMVLIGLYSHYTKASYTLIVHPNASLHAPQAAVDEKRLKEELFNKIQELQDIWKQINHAKSVQNDLHTYRTAIQRLNSMLCEKNIIKSYNITK